MQLATFRARTDGAEVLPLLRQEVWGNNSWAKHRTVDSFLMLCDIVWLCLLCSLFVLSERRYASLFFMQNHRTALLNSPDQRLKKAGQEQSKYLREKLLEGVSISSHKNSVSIIFCVCNSALISPIWKHFYLCFFCFQPFLVLWYCVVSFNESFLASFN